MPAHASFDENYQAVKASRFHIYFFEYIINNIFNFTVGHILMDVPVTLEPFKKRHDAEKIILNTRSKFFSTCLQLSVSIHACRYYSFHMCVSELFWALPRVIFSRKLTWVYNILFLCLGYVTQHKLLGFRRWENAKLCWSLSVSLKKKV